MDPTQRLGAIIFLALGLALMTASGLILRSTLSLRARAVPVDGVVLVVNEARDASGERFFSATVEWTGPDGKKRETKTHSSHLGELQPGGKVRLLYDPEDPEAPASGDLGTRWAAVTILGFIGVVFAGIAIKVAIKARGAKA